MIPPVSPLGSVDVPFLVGEVDGLCFLVNFDIRVKLTLLTCHLIDQSVSNLMIPLA